MVATVKKTSKGLGKGRGGHGRKDRGLAGVVRSRREAATPAMTAEQRRRQEVYGASVEWQALLCSLPGYDPFLQGDGCYFDEEAALFAIEFIERFIRHAKGLTAGELFILSAWQRAFVANLFGWKIRSSGLRRFREAFIYIPKKNGKTAFVAAIMLLVICTDQELGAELYSAAASKDQAALLFQHAIGMIKLDQHLAANLTPYGHKGGSQMKSIVCPDWNATYKCLQADEHTVDGVQPSFNAIDEVHRHKNRGLMDALVKGTGARKQPITIYTSTADYNRPSPCNDLRARALAVIHNTGDKSAVGWAPEFLPVIFEASKEDDWKDPAVWRKANPHLGITFTEEWFASECRKAQDDPAALNNFLRLNLNIITDADVAVIPADDWALCIGDKEAVTPEALAGRRCFSGLDLASTVDLASRCDVFLPEEDDEPVKVLWKFYMPADSVRRAEARDRVPYTTWIDQGWITQTPGNVIDYEWIKRDILGMTQPGGFRLAQMGYDPWSAMQIAVQLQEEGVPMVQVQQGFKSLSEPFKELLKLIASQGIWHGGNPVAAWQAGNLMAKTDPAGNIKPDKAKSSNKIDGMAALITALNRAIVDEPEEEAFVEFM